MHEMRYRDCYCIASGSSESKIFDTLSQSSVYTTIVLADYKIKSESDGKNIPNRWLLLIQGDEPLNDAVKIVTYCTEHVENLELKSNI